MRYWLFVLLILTIVLGIFGFTALGDGVRPILQTLFVVFALLTIVVGIASLLPNRMSEAVPTNSEVPPLKQREWRE